MATNQQRTKLEAQLAADAREIEELQDALRIARDRRNAHVVDGVDSQLMTTKAIARAAHISQTRVMAILANPPTLGA
jgi:hypothetical protein